MRRIDVCHDDPVEVATLASIRNVMGAIEEGEAENQDFRLFEADNGPLIAHVSAVVLSDTQSVAWVIFRPRGQSHSFLGIGERRDYLECMFLGAPTFIRADCFLATDEALQTLEKVIDRCVERPLRWVDQLKAVRR